jgi:hypothetical protein
MATAMSADRATMGELTKAIADLTTQLQAKDTEITTLKNRLRGHNTNNNAGNHGNQNNNNNNNYHSNSNNNHHNSQDRHQRLPQVFTGRGGYCWSHGYHVSKDTHTSANCDCKQRGHQDTAATCTNNMGGSQYCKPTT